MFQHFATARAAACLTRPCDDDDGCQAARPWIERTTVAPDGMLSQWQEQPDTKNSKNHTLAILSENMTLMSSELCPMYFIACLM